MSDLLYTGLSVAFFLLAYAFALFCRRIR